jgi:hypothetical protein
MPPLHPAVRRRGLTVFGLGGLALVAAAVLAHRVLESPDVLFAPRFPQATTLVTNEYATYNPRAPGSRRSPNWIATSGSLFARDGAGWTGAPDNHRPDVTSASGTGSTVFRVVSRSSGFGNVSIRMHLRVDSLLASSKQAWDGVHLFARYESPVHLYVVSLARRDGSVVVKKKVPSGNSASGGKYFQLGSTGYFAPVMGTWRDVRLDVRNTDGGVRIVLYFGDHLALDVVDHGEGGPPIVEPGRVGLRGDNAEFDFEAFSVRSL